MRTKISTRVLSIVAVGALAAAVLAPGAGATATAKGKPDFKVYASCANGKPFKSANHCRYDRGKYFRATFVLKSHVGKRAFRTCFQVYGPPPLGGGHACAKLKPLAYKAYPFKIAGVRQHFSVKVTWYAKTPGTDKYKKAGSSFLKVKP